MTQSSADEQFMLELVNAARATAGVQPLAMNSSINTAAELHGDYQISTNSLTHTGAGGTTAYQRMVNSGYSFNGSSTWGENVGWRSISGTTSYQDEVTAIHNWLMNSPSHRTNLLNGSFREIGIGIVTGPFQGYSSVLATQDFATATGNAFLTGVAFDDKDGDRTYDVGEGLGGAAITARNTATGAVFSAVSGASGGYSLQLPAGTYNYTFAASGLASMTGTVSIAAQNIKVDWIDPATSSGVTLPPPPPPPPAPTTGLVLTGTIGADTLTGAATDDTLTGLAGNDALNGGAGADCMIGGAGNDKYYVDSAGDAVVELAAEGIDIVHSTIAYDLSINVENLTLLGTASNGGGNALANSITGNAVANLLKGLAGNDKLYGMAGDDRLEGGDGNDLLVAGAGKDTLVGGAGSDVYDWNTIAEAGKGSTADVILDFAQGSDKIDLSTIDGVLDVAGNNAFSFIGAAAFSGVDGELRYSKVDGVRDYTLIQGDTNGDKIADFEIRLEGQLVNLQSTDFVL